jgi:hypothetical protein
MIPPFARTSLTVRVFPATTVRLFFSAGAYPSSGGASVSIFSAGTSLTVMTPEASLSLSWWKITGEPTME